MAKKEESTTGEDTLVESGEARVYELGFHLDPELPTEEVKKAYQDVRGVIAGKGEVVAEGEPLSVQLAYTMSRMDTAGRRDFSSAFFCWIAYVATPEAHAEVLAAANADKRIIRFLDLLTTKEAAQHSAELREILAKTPEREGDADSAAEAELDAAINSVAA